MLTPNNAGMFRPGVGRHRQQQQQERKKKQPELSELSYNTTTDESEGERDSGRTSGKGGGGSIYGKSSLLPSNSVPPRRMTFSGYKAGERSALYKPQRRPSFLEKAGKRAVEVAVAATKATRKLSLYGNNGEGAELVACLLYTSDAADE